MYLMYNPSICTNCRRCQLACSFHHTGTFSPSNSSIEVIFNNRTGLIKWSVDTTCDQCVNEKGEIPQCVRRCSTGALNWSYEGKRKPIEQYSFSYRSRVEEKEVV